MTAQWGDSGWGEAGFAESGGPFAHAVSARGAVNTAAYASRLSTTHVVAASGTVASRVVSIGYGPGAIHPVSASGTVDVLVSAPNLRFSHNVAASGTIDVLTDAAYLSHQHHVSAAGTVETFAEGGLSGIHFVSAQGMVDAPAWATMLARGHSVSAFGTITSLATAREVVDIPTLTVLPVMGVVNLIVDPAAVSTLESWDVENGAILNGFDTDHIWFGDHSVAVEFHDPAMHERLIVGTPPGIGLIAYPGSVLWSAVMLAVGAATDVTANVWTRVQYSDTTVVDGDPIEAELVATGETPDVWQRVDAPFVSLDSDLALEQAWVVVEILTAGAFPLVVYVGGAQVELDSLMTGPAPLIALEPAA